MSNQIQEPVRNKIYQRLDKLKPDTPAQWGSMSVAQMLAHMNDAFRLSMGMKEAVDRSTIFTNKIMFPVAVYVLPRWPKSSATAPELTQGKLGTPARDFYTEVEFVKKMIDVFNEREANKLKPHPMFGALNKKQWRDLLVKHLDHHLRQFGV